VLTLDADKAFWAKVVNDHFQMEAHGRYVPCGYSCGKWIFFSWQAEDNGDHRYHTDVFGCGPCEDEAFRKEFGEDFYDYADPWDLD
jgi:hypothetical protein